MSECDPDKYKCIKNGLLETIKRLKTQEKLTISQKAFIHYSEKILSTDPIHVKKQILTNIKCEYNFVIFVQEPSVWGSLKSVYDALISRNDCTVSVVYVHFSHNSNLENDEIKRYRKLCPDVITIERYNIQKESPDIAIFVKPYDEYIQKKAQFRYVEKLVDYTVYIPYGMEFNVNLIKYSFNSYLHARVWRHIGHGPLVKEYGSKYGFCDG